MDIMNSMYRYRCLDRQHCTTYYERNEFPPTRRINNGFYSTIKSNRQLDTIQHANLHRRSSVERTGLVEKIVSRRQI